MIKLLRSRLSDPLPGLQAQLELATSGRGSHWVVRPDHKMGGVLILLYPKLGQWYILLMKRTEDGGAHSGQICFPGGRMEKGDSNISFTALRESWEELGIVPSEVEVMGQLTELYIPISNYLVVPTLGIAGKAPRFVPNASEVSAVIEAPLSYLLSPASRTYAEVVNSRGLHMEVPAFVVNGEVVWGATAMMLNELLALMR
ncbi:MAG: CoA pyrophosphatase [Bacteroidia bacterium]|nr:CoA pyrophosphatase [Bacteroidia bacterium]